MKTRITRRYLAGLMDGEGYISIKPAYYKGRSIHSPVIKMALTEKSAFILFEIKKLLGGHIYRREYKNQNYNAAYCWDVHNFDGVKKVLDYVRPYLILKKEQADLVYKLISTKHRSLKNDGCFDKLDSNVMQKRHSLYTAVKKLNRRGCAATSTERETPTVIDEGEATVRTPQECGEVNGTETLTHSVN